MVKSMLELITVFTKGVASAAFIQKSSLSTADQYDKGLLIVKHAYRTIYKQNYNVKKIESSSLKDPLPPPKKKINK